MASTCSFTFPLSTSSGPTTTARRAPERSAARNCAFIDRASKARSADSPARRSSAVTSRASSPPVMSTTHASTAVSGSSNTPSASQASSTRSTPVPKPMPGVGGPESTSASPSYRPPPPMPFWADSRAEAFTSKVVRV